MVAKQCACYAKHMPNNRSHYTIDTLCHQLIHAGSDTLLSPELIALIIADHSDDQQALTQAYELQRRFALSQLKNINYSIVSEGVHHLNRLQFARMQASLHLSERCHYEKQTTAKLKSTRQLLDFLRPHFCHLKREALGCLILDTKSHLLDFAILFQGTVDRVPCYLREIASYTLKNNATQVAIVHNHVHEGPKPSQADTTLTKKIQQLLKTLGIQLTDHLILSPTGYYSFAEHGLL